jgi:hypothetical protein
MTGALNNPFGIFSCIFKVEDAGSRFSKSWVPTQEPQAVRFNVIITRGMFRKVYA